MGGGGDWLEVGGDGRGAITLLLLFSRTQRGWQTSPVSASFLVFGFLIIFLVLPTPPTLTYHLSPNILYASS